MGKVVIQPKLNVPGGTYCEEVEVADTSDGEIMTVARCRFCKAGVCVLFKGTLNTSTHEDYGVSLHGKDAYCKKLADAAAKPEAASTPVEPKGE